VLVAYAPGGAVKVADVGLLTWAAAGIAFLGTAGGVAIPMAAVRAGSVRPVRWRSSRRALRLELASGEVHVFRFLGVEADAYANLFTEIEAWR
jgi:hypothetical protein